MTARDMQRIRSRLEKAAQLTEEAYQIYSKANPGRLGDPDLRYIVALAANNGHEILERLRRKDEKDRATAQSIAASLRDEQGMTEQQKQSYRRFRAAGLDRQKAREKALELGGG